MSSEMSHVIMKYSIPSLSSVEQNDHDLFWLCVCSHLLSFSSKSGDTFFSVPVESIIEAKYGLVCHLSLLRAEAGFEEPWRPLTFVGILADGSCWLEHSVVLRHYWPQVAWDCIVLRKWQTYPNWTKTTPTLPLEPLDITQLLYNSECILPFPPEAGNVVFQLHGIWANEKRNDTQVDLNLFRISNIHPSEATHIRRLSPSPRRTAQWLRTNKSEFKGWVSLGPHYGWKWGWPCCSAFCFFWYFELSQQGAHCKYMIQHCDQNSTS